MWKVIPILLLIGASLWLGGCCRCVRWRTAQIPVSYCKKVEYSDTSEQCKEWGERTETRQICEQCQDGSKPL